MLDYKMVLVEICPVTFGGWDALLRCDQYKLSVKFELSVTPECFQLEC